MRKLKFIRLAAVMDRTALKETTLYEGIQQGIFPPSFPIAARCVAWREDQIDEWCKARAEGRTLRYQPPASSRTSRPLRDVDHVR